MDMKQILTLILGAVIILSGLWFLSSLITPAG